MPKEKPLDPSDDAFWLGLIDDMVAESEKRRKARARAAAREKRKNEGMSGFRDLLPRAKARLAGYDRRRFREKLNAKVSGVPSRPQGQEYISELEKRADIAMERYQAGEGEMKRIDPGDGPPRPKRLWRKDL